MPTPDLFDFTTENLADYDLARVRRALRQHSAIYVNHLQIAVWIDGWRERLDRDSELDNEDFSRALAEIAAHLRQADFVPDGPLIEEHDVAVETELDRQRLR